MKPNNNHAYCSSFHQIFNLTSRENYLVNEVQISKSLSIEETLSQCNLLRR